MHRAICRASLALVLLLHAGPTRADRAADDNGVDEAFQALKHRVIVSEILIAPLADFPSPEAAVVALRKLSRPEIRARNGFWRFHFVAFMEPSPDTAEVQMVMTDVTEPRHRREVKVFEAETAPGAHELAVNDLVLTEEMGFERGHRFELAVTRGGDDRNGKADVLALGMVTLR
jgi:hypothetical protein